MDRWFLCRIFVCIFVVSLFLYLYTDQHNDLTKLRFRVPALTKEMHSIREENRRLQYAIDRFESPQNLIELARQSEFSHLKQPLLKEVLTCQEGVALRMSTPEEKKSSHNQINTTLAAVR